MSLNRRVKSEIFWKNLRLLVQVKFVIALRSGLRTFSLNLPEKILKRNALRLRLYATQNINKTQNEQIPK